MTNLKTVIGLEIHAELLTKTKIFCSCENSYDKTPNSNICPICTGQPGTLPSLNSEAKKLAIKAGLIFNSKINESSLFERKNYFYPDTPKSYQITQNAKPICECGGIELSNGHYIRINRIQLEEDAAKMTHETLNTFINFNRSGVPLIEIVTEPDLKAEEVGEFIQRIALMLKYAGISEAKMDKGSFRVDVNISISKDGQTGLRVEIKNLNSIKYINEAIKYEIKRQTSLLREGSAISQETRRFDEKRKITLPLRTKEEASDYRYFFDTNLPMVFVSNTELEELRKEIPMMPEERFKLYVIEYRLSENDARTIVSNKLISDFFDSVVILFKNYKLAANFILTEVLKHLKAMGLAQLPFTAKAFAKLLDMISNGLNRSNAKKILKIMFKTGKDPEEIAKEMKLISVYETPNLEKTREVVDQLIESNPELVDKYRNGKTNVLGHFMGKAMSEFTGDPKILAQEFTKKLKKIN